VRRRSDIHYPKPKVVTVTQSTEVGTLYMPGELRAIGAMAKKHHLRVHMDGARFANAVAALGCAPREITWQAGVDVLSFGGTKNGMMYGEAVVFLNRRLAEFAGYVRKQITQLPSKVRYVSAQFSALLDGDLWLTNAVHANDMARRLHAAVAHRTDLTVGPPVVNSLFPAFSPTVSPAAVEALRAWSFFYDWDPHHRQVRWMTSWDTTDEDIERFVVGLDHHLG